MPMHIPHPHWILFAPLADVVRRSMINIARYLKFVFRVAVHGVFPISIQFFVDTTLNARQPETAAMLT
jgi:hypothetical protein